MDFGEKIEETTAANQYCFKEHLLQIFDPVGIRGRM